MITSNQALSDELEAVNSIYTTETLSVTAVDTVTAERSAILTLPDLPLSFLLSFPVEYPDAPPSIVSTQSTGASLKIGQGEIALDRLRIILGRIFSPGQVCLFDLIEESTSILEHEVSNLQSGHKDGSTDLKDESNRVNLNNEFSTAVVSNLTEEDSPDIASSPMRGLTNSRWSLSAGKAASASITPDWILSQPLVINRSTFVARALKVDNVQEAKDSLGHLLATNKKVAGATHNITAWRIKQKQNLGATVSQEEQTKQQQHIPEIVIQDCDDDGETAAGGRLLHLMQMTDAWNVMVVVTRWYGGVKLGPDRFKCINTVARQALVEGRFIREMETKSSSNKVKTRKK